MKCERCGEVNPAEIHTCTPKREWQGLTDEEITEAYAGGMHVLFGDANKGFARAIEAKLKEKNA